MAVQIVEEINGLFKPTGELQTIFDDPDIQGKKIYPIFIAGKMREGKSFILNLFVAYLEWKENGSIGEWLNEQTPMDRFDWKCQTNRHTTGIYMWSKPYILKDSNDEDIVVLLMDTQGTFDLQTSYRGCSSIFALSTLLSSVLIFNVSKQVSMDVLTNLNFFTKYADLAQTKSGNKRKTFQKIIFLIRDFQNSMEFPYGFEGGKRYLDEVVFNVTNATKDLRRFCEDMEESFSERACFLMAHPGESIAINNNKNVLGEMKPEFKECIKRFIPVLFAPENLIKKHINGKDITVSIYTEVFKIYAEILQKEEMDIAPDNLFKAGCEGILTKLLKESMQIYAKIPNLESLSDLNLFERNHNDAKAAALKHYEDGKALGDDELEKKYRDELLSMIQAKYTENKRIVTLNKEKADFKLKEEKAKQEHDERMRKLEEEFANLELIKNKTKEEQRKFEELQEQIREEREAENQRRKEEEEKRQIEKQRRDRESKSENLMVVGEFYPDKLYVKVITNLEIRNRTRYALCYQPAQSNTEWGEIARPLSNIGPYELYRCGFFEPNIFFSKGCRGDYTYRIEAPEDIRTYFLLGFNVPWNLFSSRKNGVHLHVKSNSEEYKKGDYTLEQLEIQTSHFRFTVTMGGLHHCLIAMDIWEVEAE